MIFKINNTLEDSSISTYKILIKFILLSFALVQIVISNFNLYVIFTVFLIIFFTFLTIELFFNKKNLIFYFFPTLLIFSLNLLFLTGPLIFKTIFLQNINSNLDLPFFSYFIASMYQLTVNLALLFYKKNYKFINLSKLIANKIFKRMRLFEEPNIRYMIFIFFIVFINKYYLNFIDQGPTKTSEFGDVGFKILYKISLFYYLPLIFSFKFFFIDKKINNFTFYSIILFYMASAFILSLGANRRSDFYTIFLILFILISFYKIFLSNNFGSFSKVYILFLLVIIIFSNIFISSNILKNRSDRFSLKPKDLLLQSLDFSQPINHRSKSVYEQGMTFTDNEIIDRLIQIKWLDYNLRLAKNLSYKDAEEFTETVKGKYLGIFPQNFINIFSKNFKKQDYVVATGSMLEKATYGRYLGGALNVGSYLVELKVLFNSYFIIFIVVFILFLFTITMVQSFQLNTDTEIIFAPIIFIISPHLFWLVASDTSGQFVYFFIRGAWELVLLYYILFFLSKKNL